MAFNPFHRFRKHQKVFFAALTIVCMFVFVLQFGTGDAIQRMLAWFGSGQRGVAFVRLSLVPPSYLTLFDRIGDTVPWAAIAICVLAALVALNQAHHPQRLVGIMGNGNRRPVSSVSLSEAMDRDRVPDSAGEGGGDVRAGGPAHRIEERP